MSKTTQKTNVGNRVLFVGGPEAGNIRVIPESHGSTIKAPNDWVYRIWPVKMPGNNQTAYFAYAADQHPLQLFIDMWREYSPAAQIKRGHETLSYSELGQKKS